MSNLGSIRVPTSGSPTSKLWVVGESPGQSEEQALKPFVGESGTLLLDTLAQYGIRRESIYMTNLCQFRPKDNLFEHCLGTQQLTDGQAEIYNAIVTYSPNLILALGARAVHFLTNRHGGILSLRGALLACKHETTVKVFCSIHPSYVLRNSDTFPIFAFDIGRAVDQSKSKVFPVTRRDYHILHSHADAIDAQQEILKSDLIAVDIETTRKEKDIICVGIATSPNKAFVFPWNPTNEHLIKEILEKESIAKLYHYGVGFDIERLFLAGINNPGTIHDTFVLANALMPGFPRALAFLQSIFTFEPPYKDEGRDALPTDSKAWGVKSDRDSIYIYNAKDCVVLYEIFLAMMAEISEEDKETYLFDMTDQIEVAQAIGRNGLPIDTQRRSFLAAVYAYKIAFANTLLSTIIGKKINVNSHVTMKWLFYDHLQLPVQKHYKTKKPTTNDDAIVYLLEYCASKVESYRTEAKKTEWRFKLEVVKSIRDIREHRKLISAYLINDLYLPNLMRSIYLAAGTKTGRYSAGKYIDDTGFGPQTLSRGKIDIPNHLIGKSPEEIMGMIDVKAIILDVQSAFSEDEPSDT